jgi:hypothetical protein
MLIVATKPAQWMIRHHKWDFSGPFTHSIIDLSFLLGALLRLVAG